MKIGCRAFAAIMCCPALAFAAAPRAGWMAPGFADAMKTAGVIYVSDIGNAVVDIYTKAIPNKLVGRITSGLCLPTGLAVDASGTLYAASFYGECAGPGPSISVYPAGSTTPSLTIIDAMYDPVALALSANGTLYATDEGHNVLEFDHAHARVSRIVFPRGGNPNGVAISPSGDLFITYLDTAGWHVGRFDVTRHVFVDQGIPLTYGGGIAFDKAGNLIAVDQRAGQVEVFAPGATTPTMVYGGFSDPYTIALDPDGKTLYVDDIGNRRIEELAYPSGRSLGAISGFTDNTFGLAVSAPPGKSAALWGR